MNDDRSGRSASSSVKRPRDARAARRDRPRESNASDADHVREPAAVLPHLALLINVTPQNAAMVKYSARYWLKVRGRCMARLIGVWVMTIGSG